MSNIAIEFDNVGKMYRLGRVGTGTLSHDLNRWWTMNVLRKEDPYLKIGQTNDRTTKGDSDYVWALKDISFKVEQGEVVGIIGKNGAGKSTLLKLLSHITAPTTGSIKYQGRIASLLEVGTGFHPEMTGRENIYMNGSIMGMTKQEITHKLDEIVDFAGVERYLDTPVKRYSSGMTVRLGFAVAAFLEPEILVVDEVLTVGDAEFQKKAIGKMDSVAKEGGRTVLFVSHNMGTIRQLCQSGVLLENGIVKYIGTAQDTVTEYLRGDEIASSIDFQKRADRIGNGKIVVNKIEIKSCNDDVLDTVMCGQDFKFVFHYESYFETVKDNVILSLKFTDVNGLNLSLIHNRLTGQPFRVEPGKGTFECSLKHCPLNAGEYFVSYTILPDNGRGQYLDGMESAVKLNIIGGDFYRTGEIAPYSFGPLLIAANYKNTQK